MGENKTLEKADAQSSKGKEEGGAMGDWETKGDKTLGKADTPSKKRYNGSQDPQV